MVEKLSCSPKLKGILEIVGIPKVLPGTEYSYLIKQHLTSTLFLNILNSHDVRGKVFPRFTTSEKVGRQNLEQKASFHQKDITTQSFEDLSWELCFPELIDGKDLKSERATFPNDTSFFPDSHKLTQLTE